MRDSNSNRAKMAAVKQLILSSVMLFIQVVVFFVSAGNIAVRPIIFFSASFLHYFFSIVIQYKLNPELLSVRLRIKREGSKLWDEILMRLSNLTVLIAVPTIAGLDVGRFYWSNLDFSFVALGLILFAISTFFLNWAMAVNPYFEPTVRIQKDRGHRVITGGPYKIVRHPGYLAGILYIFSTPLIIGSVLTFIPVVVYDILIIIRTSLEDRTLHRELEEYSRYAEKVRYRLIPWIW